MKMTEQKIDCKKLMLVNGEIKEAKTNLENLKNFIERWQEKIKEIKTLCLDNRQSYNLAEDYLAEWTPFMYQDELESKSEVLGQLIHDLFLAITKANTNYRKQFPTVLDRFHKLKLPEFNLIKKE